MSITVEKARTDAERQAVYRFRYRVYVEEMGLSPPEADHVAKRLRDPLDLSSDIYALKDESEVVGSLRVTYFDDAPDPASLVARYDIGPALRDLPRDAICITSRFMLDPNVRHGTAIFRLMEAAWEDVASRGARIAYGDCSPHLVPFYEHLGFRRYTRAYNDTAYGFKVPILMLVRDLARFDRVHSPLTRVVKGREDDLEGRAWFTRTYPDYLGMESAAFLAEGVFFDLLAERVAKDPMHALSPLRGMDRAEADLFLAEATTIKAEKGDRIVRQGERGDTLFVLLSGVAEVTLDESPESPVAVLGAGDPFGEIGFLTSEPRTANVIARAPCEVLVLSGDFLQRFIGQQPAVAAKALLNLSRVLASRLALTTRRALGRAQGRPSPPLP